MKWCCWACAPPTRAATLETTDRDILEDENLSRYVL